RPAKSTSKEQCRRLRRWSRVGCVNTPSNGCGCTGAGGEQNGATGLNSSNTRVAPAKRGDGLRAGREGLWFPAFAGMRRKRQRERPSARYFPVLILVHSRFISPCVFGSCALMV